jgi:transposase-like protein
VFVSERQDAAAARRFFDRAISPTLVTPSEVVTNKAAVYPKVRGELVPAPWHRTDRYANNRLEADHGQLKRRLRPMRGVKTDLGARVVIAGHAFVQTSGAAITNWPSTHQPNCVSQSPSTNSPGSRTGERARRTGEVGDQARRGQARLVVGPDQA